jgi:long-chain acyl-CoA synthetase
MFTGVANKNSDRIAIAEGGTKIRYDTLAKEIYSFAQILRRQGVRTGDSVALLLSNSSEFVISYFAIVTAGAIVVPLNDHYQQTELIYFIETCKASILVTSRNYEELCAQVFPQLGVPCKILFVEERISQEENIPTPVVPEINTHTPVMFQFSSGTTGRPKKIARTHANILFEL